MPIVRIKDDRFGRLYRTGLNGRFFELPVDEDIEIADDLLDHLRSLDVSVEDAPKRAGSSSKEGSVEVGPAHIASNLARDAEIADALVATELAERAAAEAAAAPEAPAPEEKPKKAAPKKAAGKAAKKK